MKNTAFSLIFLLLTTMLPAQQPTRSVDDDAYGSRFFDQLRTIFGRFRDSDLQHAFQDAQPIQCSELIGRKGEWRPVAFFNEDRSLGAWHRESLEEVKSDLSVYTFKGECSGRESIEVTTEFPTSASFQRYREGSLTLDQIDVTVNDPVKAVLSDRTKAYTFELPYLFPTANDSRKVYSLIAPDRNAAYAKEVSSRWECKAVSSKDVTFRFLICRVSTVPQKTLGRNETWEPSFGSSAFFILSDGTEARSSVNLTFGDEPSQKNEESVAPQAPARPKLKR